jgi:hypothetical protein
MNRSDLRNALYAEFKKQSRNGKGIPTARQIDDLAQLLLAENIQPGAISGDVAVMATVLGWNSAQFWAVHADCANNA